jgi:DNA-binding CsgD family transcriptional regulator
VVTVLNPALAALYERDLERRRLDDAGRLACAGSGSLVLIECGAGLGKSALLRWAAGTYTAAGLRTLSSRGAAQERSFAFGVVRQLFDHVVADPKLRAVALRGAADNSLAIFEPGASIGPEQGLHSLYWLTANLCSIGPLALLVDDVHDADDASVTFLDYLARRLDDLGLVIVCTARPVGQVESRPVLDQVRTAAQSLRPAPLSPQGVAAVIAEVVGPEYSAVAAAAHAATGGNPFYVRELLREAQRRDVRMDVADEAWLAELGAPVIMRAVLFRLASMQDGAVRLARAAAVLGEGARLRDCAVLAAVDIDAAATIADALHSAGILDAGPHVNFAHPILRSAVYNDVGPHERARWHARAAAVCRAAGAAAETVAGHLLRCEPSGDPADTSSLRKAAADATAKGVPALAIDFLTRALAEPLGEDDRASVQFELGLASALVGRPDALSALMDAVRRTRDPLLRGQRALVLSTYGASSRRLAAVLDLFDEVLAALPRDDPDLVLRLQTERYWTAHLDLSTVGRTADLQERMRSALDRPDDELRRRLLVYLAMDAARIESRAVALEYVQQATAAPGLLAFCPPDATSVFLALLTLSSIEEHEMFAALAADALVEAGRRGNPFAFVLVSTLRCIELMRLGRLQEAAAEAETTCSTPAVATWSHGFPGLIASWIFTLILQGRCDVAQGLLDEFGVVVEDALDYPSALLLEARASLRLAQGDAVGALADAQRAGACLEPLGVLTPGMTSWRRVGTESALVTGDHELARALADEELALAERLGGPLAMSEARRLLGRVVGGQHGLTFLIGAAEIADAAPSPLLRAQVHADLGTALRSAGRVGAAREHLGIALDAAAGCGAEAMAAHARTQLVAAGGRPRRAYRSGPGSLTAAELRVARLAADGHTNRAIAQALFLSRKTVEKHLANVYRKLNIATRAQLDPSLLTQASR